MAIRRYSTLIGILTCWGCGQSGGGRPGPNPNPNPEQQGFVVAQQRVSPQVTTTIESPAYGVRLDIPAGAVESPVEIVVRRVERGGLAKGLGGGATFELSPDGLHFAKPVTLTLPESFALQQNENSFLRVVQVFGDGSWKPVPRAATSEAGVVSAQLAHFSSYAVADLALAGATRETLRPRIDAVDVLFVVDNSESMQQEQDNLAANFPKLVERLNAAELDFRVGVVSTDLGVGFDTDGRLSNCSFSGDAGRLLNDRGTGQPECTGPRDPWLEQIAGQSNAFDGNVSAAFSCMARRGTTGCGFEQPLEAMHKALDPETNPGFIRDNAALAVVIISDEDDCSTRDPALFSLDDAEDRFGPLSSFRCFDFGVSCDLNDGSAGERKDCRPTEGGYLFDVKRYVDRLRQLKPDGTVAVSLIAAPVDSIEVGRDLDGHPTLLPSCQSDSGSAAPPVRLAHFVKAFGSRGLSTSICQDDLGPAMSAVGQLVAEQSKLDWCLPFEVTDTDPGTAALEADCEVQVVGQALPRCAGDGDTMPCFVVQSAAGCDRSGITLHNIAADALGEAVSVRCLAED